MLVPAVLLILGLLAQTLSASHPEQIHCEESFYRHTVPEHIGQSGLERMCQGSSGCSFTSLYHPDCQNSVYTALHLSHGNAWSEGASGENDELWSGESSRVFVPTLYKRKHHVSSASLSPLQKVDSLTAELVESQVIPLCSKNGGDMYIQSGVGSLNSCDAEKLWTAICCSATDGDASFSMGMVLEGDEHLKLVTVEELEKLVGIQELFSGGCGQGGPPLIAHSKESLSKVHNLGNKLNPAETLSDGEMEKESFEENTNSQAAETSPDEVLTEESTNANESELECSESALVYVLSSTFSLLCATLSPVISTVTNLPSQLTYVLQEDVAILATLPQDSLIVVRDLSCGVVSGVENVWNVFYQVIETAVGSLYICLSTLVGTLLLSCQEGLTGTGTLMSDTLGLATGTLEQTWDLGGTLVGRAGWSLVEYLGTMSCEMGHQARTVGGGVQTLVWRSQRGLGHLLNTMGAVVGGVVENAVETVQEVFGGVENVVEDAQETSEGVENVVEKLQEA